MKAIKSIREIFQRILQEFFRILSGIKNFWVWIRQIRFSSAAALLPSAQLRIALLLFILPLFGSGLPVRPTARCFLTESSCKALLCYGQAAKRIAHISLDNSNHLSGIIKRSTNMLRLWLLFHLPALLCNFFSVGIDGTAPFLDTAIPDATVAVFSACAGVFPPRTDARK